MLRVYFSDRLAYRCLQMKWCAAVTVVAIPSRKALLMCPYVSSGKFSVLAPRCSHARRLAYYGLRPTSDRRLIFAFLLPSFLAFYDSRTYRSCMGNFIGIRARAVIEKWAGRRIGWFGAGRERKTKSSARVRSMEKKLSQTEATKQRPKQERGRIGNAAKDSQCAGKRGSDRKISNAQ